jgi:hypothetical protein
VRREHPENLAFQIHLVLGTSSFLRTQRDGAIVVYLPITLKALVESL